METDDTKARNVKGVTDVVVLPHAVAVISDAIEATVVGKQKLKVKWSEASRFRRANTAASIAVYTEKVKNLINTGPAWNEKSDVRAAMVDAKDAVEALYTSEPVYHAQIKPLNATASVSEDGKFAEIWVGTQTQSLVIMGSVETLGTPTIR